MTGLLLMAVGILYLGTAISYYIDGNTGMAIAFTCYACANFGLYIGASK